MDCSNSDLELYPHVQIRDGSAVDADLRAVPCRGGGGGDLILDKILDVIARPEARNARGEGDVVGVLPGQVEIKLVADVLVLVTGSISGNAHIIERPCVGRGRDPLEAEVPEGDGGGQLVCHGRGEL